MEDSGGMKANASVCACSYLRALLLAHICMTRLQGRIQDFKNGGVVILMRAKRARKFSSHAHLIKTTPVLITSALSQVAPCPTLNLRLHHNA